MALLREETRSRDAAAAAPMPSVPVGPVARTRRGRTTSCGAPSRVLGARADLPRAASEGRHLATAFFRAEPTVSLTP